MYFCVLTVQDTLEWLACRNINILKIFCTKDHSSSGSWTVSDNMEKSDNGKVVDNMEVLMDIGTHEKKLYKCTVPGCPYTEYKSCYLNRHMKTHISVKPYVCNICGT